MSKLPTIFIPHGGGPCFFMDWDPPDTWERMAEYLRSVPGDIGSPAPKALVVISGHWEEPVVTIQNNPAPPLLYDYHGFPPSTYEIKFPAPGAPKVSARVAELLSAADIAWKYDHERGFDHGVFIPLKVAFPQADIPIVQVSLLASMDAAEHIRVGRALAPLRDEGVLIVGSGMTYHNMRTLMASMRRGGSQRRRRRRLAAFRRLAGGGSDQGDAQGSRHGARRLGQSAGRPRRPSARGTPAAASRRGRRRRQRSGTPNAQGRGDGRCRVGVSLRLRLKTAAALRRPAACRDRSRRRKSAAAGRWPADCRSMSAGPSS